MLFWNERQQAVAFKSFERLYSSRLVARGDRVRSLPLGEPLKGTGDIDRFMKDDRVFGMLVLQDGKIRLERYAKGFTPNDRWSSYSVVKSMTSTLVGAAIADGKIKSVDDLITDYLPSLKGSGYDGVTIRNALNMSSGVAWNEGYLDPSSDTNAIVRILANRESGGLLAHMAKKDRVFEPGTKFDYDSGTTHVLGAVVAAATGRHLSDYLSEKVWRPAGMEADAPWITDGPKGQEFAGCCINARLRDFARFGQFILEGAKDRTGKSILPVGWMATATAGSPATPGYSYQWWLFPQAHSFAAIGVFGQLIYIDPTKNLVIVMLSAFPTPVNKEFDERQELFVKDISRHVAASAR